MEVHMHKKWQWGGPSITIERVIDLPFVPRIGEHIHIEIDGGDYDTGMRITELIHVFADDVYHVSAWEVIEVGTGIAGPSMKREMEWLEKNTAEIVRDELNLGWKLGSSSWRGVQEQLKQNENS